MRDRHGLPIPLGYPRGAARRAQMLRYICKASGRVSTGILHRCFDAVNRP